MTRAHRLAWTTLLLLACGKGEPKPAAAADAAPAAAASADAAPAAEPSEPAAAAPTGSLDLGTCEVTMTGDLTDEYKVGGGAMAFGTERWMTPEERELAARQLIGLVEKDEKVRDQKIKEALADKEKPLINLFLMNCYGPKTKITLGPSQGTKMSDVPMAAKTYAVVGGMKTKPGQFQALWTVQDQMVSVDGGELAITTFDTSKVAGTFAMTGELKDLGNPGAAAKKLAVKGRFEFKCINSQACTK